MENEKEEIENTALEEEGSSLDIALKLLGYLLVVLFMVILTTTVALPLLDINFLVVLIAIPVMLIVLAGLFFAARKCLGMTNLELVKMIYFFQIVVPTVLVSLYIIVAAIVYMYQSGRF